MKNIKTVCELCGQEKLCGYYDCYDNYHGYADANPISLGMMFICNDCLDEQKEVGETNLINEEVDNESS